MSVSRDPKAITRTADLKTRFRELLLLHVEYLRDEGVLVVPFRSAELPRFRNLRIYELVSYAIEEMLSRDAEFSQSRFLSSGIPV